MPFLFISCFYIHILVFEIALHRKRIPKSMQSNLLLIPLHLKWKKIQGLFKDLHRNSRTFQGKMAFKDFSRTHPEIQGLFKTVRTLLAQNMLSLIMNEACSTTKNIHIKGCIVQVIIDKYLFD